MCPSTSAPLLDENAGCFVLLGVDGEMESREAVFGERACLRWIVGQYRPQPLNAAKGCSVEDRKLTVCRQEHLRLLDVSCAMSEKWAEPDIAQTTPRPSQLPLSAYEADPGRGSGAVGRDRAAPQLALALTDLLGSRAPNRRSRSPLPAGRRYLRHRRGVGSRTRCCRVWPDGRHRRSRHPRS